MTWLLLCAALGVSFIGGWTCGVWLCSKRRWCPIYLQQSLDAWRAQLEHDNRKRKASEQKAIKRKDPP